MVRTLVAKPELRKDARSVPAAGNRAGTGEDVTDPLRILGEKPTEKHGAPGSC